MLLMLLLTTLVHGSPQARVPRDLLSHLNECVHQSVTGALLYLDIILKVLPGLLSQG